MPIIKKFTDLETEMAAFKEKNGGDCLLVSSSLSTIIYARQRRLPG